MSWVTIIYALVTQYNFNASNQNNYIVHVPLKLIRTYLLVVLADIMHSALQ